MRTINSVRNSRLRALPVSRDECLEAANGNNGGLDVKQSYTGIQKTAQLLAECNLYACTSSNVP